MNVLDLCSGIGGFSLGLHWAGGFKTIAFCEKDLACQRVLKNHWPNVPIFDDIFELTEDKLDGLDNPRLVVSGYPCQPFSIAGVRLGSQDDRNLWPEVFRIIETIRPAWFIGENVTGHLSMGFEGVLADLESAGYRSQTFIIPACAVDAPHQRNRIFIIAYTDRERLEGREEKRDSERRGKLSFGPRNTLEISKRGWLPGTGLCGVDDGIPRKLDGIKRVDRIKMLGNSVVPQIIEIIGRGILEHD